MEQARSLEEVLGAATVASEKLRLQVEVEMSRADDAQSQVEETQRALAQAEMYLKEQQELASTVRSSLLSLRSALLFVNPVKELMCAR